MSLFIDEPLNLTNLNSESKTFIEVIPLDITLSESEEIETSSTRHPLPDGSSVTGSLSVSGRVYRFRAVINKEIDITKQILIDLAYEKAIFTVTCSLGVLENMGFDGVLSFSKDDNSNSIIVSGTLRQMNIARSQYKLIPITKVARSTDKKGLRSRQEGVNLGKKVEGEEITDTKKSSWLAELLT